MALKTTGNTHRSFHSSRGLSLIELLVSILLGLLLTTGIVNVYLDSKRNFTAEEDMARIQENGRFTLNLLKRELMLSGFYAGSFGAESLSYDDATPTVASTSSTAWALDGSDAVELIDDFSGSLVTVNGTTLSWLSASEVQATSDIFSVKRTAGNYTVRSGGYNEGITAADPNQWYLKVVNHGSENSWLNVGAGSFASTDITSDPNQPADPNDPGRSVDYWEMYASVFYIRNYSTVTSDQIPTLCMARLTGSGMTSDCLVEGVENMQIEFGIDTDSDGIPNRFKDAPTASELANAVVARVYVLIRGTSRIAGYTNAKTYNLGQQAVAARNDAFLRRVFSTTVQMRNATLPTL